MVLLHISNITHQSAAILLVKLSQFVQLMYKNLFFYCILHNYVHLSDYSIMLSQKW